ncbi:MAG: DUF444 family protein [Candidatus Obscuribacterales bacterium]|nr:DUF444 family protein [Candidatus Obscuribacterales bacterium]
MAKRRRNKAVGNQLPTSSPVEPRIVLLDQHAPMPFALNTHELALQALLGGGVITPPPGPGRDRTGPDKDRFRKRTRAKLDKNKLKDILTDNPVFGDKGKVRVPVDGGKEPRWRPGRDGKGGGGRGRKGGQGSEEPIYVDIEYEEFIQWLFEDLELPFLERKDRSKTLIKTYKLRGLAATGPDSRIDWEHTEISRVERAMGMLTADPESFPLLGTEVLKALLQVLAKLAVHKKNPLQASDITAAKEALENLLNKGAEALPLPEGSLASLALFLAEVRKKRRGLPGIDEELDDRLSRALSALKADPNKLPLLDPEKDVPSERDVPYQKTDFVYKRIEVRYDPDSRAVVFLILDRSGSMGGDPLAIAKFYFLLNIMFLRTRYKEVEVVMIAHDGDAYEIKDEKNFYQIEVGGGTMFAPAYEMTFQIAQQRYPNSIWNRYMFQATDGYMFDGEEQVRDWWDRIIRKGGDGGGFNFGGYLEIDPWGGMSSWRGSSWAPGGQALRMLRPEIMRHVGMARVSNMDGVVDAFKAILTGDRNQEEV